VLDSNLHSAISTIEEGAVKLFEKMISDNLRSLYQHYPRDALKL
jgi:hypothetical protein